MDVIEAWLDDLGKVLNKAPLMMSEIRIGVFFTAAELSTGHVGVAFTPRDLTDTVCCPRSAAQAPQAGRLAGQEAWDLAEYALSPIPLRRAVGVASLNALSALAMERHGTPGGRLVHGADALEAAGIQPEDRVAMVGAFPAFIKALKGRVAALAVVDKHQEALKADELLFWRPPQHAAEVVSQASVVVITGSVLVEGGIDPLLHAAKSARRVVLAGPTASPWPPTFFKRGVHVLGGIRVRDGRKILRIVGEGGSGYFFEEAAEKICAIRESGDAPALAEERGEGRTVRG